MVTSVIRTVLSVPDYRKLINGALGTIFHFIIGDPNSSSVEANSRSSEIFSELLWSEKAMYVSTDVIRVFDGFELAEISLFIQWFL